MIKAEHKVVLAKKEIVKVFDINKSMNGGKI